MKLSSNTSSYKKSQSDNFVNKATHFTIVNHIRTFETSCYWSMSGSGAGGTPMTSPGATGDRDDSFIEPVNGQVHISWLKHWTSNLGGKSRHQIWPKLTPLAPLSHLNDCFTYNLILSVTQLNTPSAYLCNIIYEWFPSWIFHWKRASLKLIYIGDLKSDHSKFGNI